MLTTKKKQNIIKKSQLHGKANANIEWKDTTTIPSGQTYELLVVMDNPGEWMLHCHIAEHLETGMAITFEVKE
jgi:FtsP/CotA-like multicopper oxidase with cupredoxin domain